MTRRILSIDYGKKRIGLAISDPMQMIASPLQRVMAEKNHEATAKAIKAVLNEKKYEIEKIIMGDPKHLDGKPSPMSLEVAAFAPILEKILGCPVTLMDERLSSKEGEKLLIQASVKRKKRGDYIDTMSATLLLQAYLTMPKPF